MVEITAPWPMNGVSHAARFSEIGMMRRAAVFAWVARSSMSLRSRFTALQSSRESSAARMPLKPLIVSSGMRWDGAARRSFSNCSGVKISLSFGGTFTLRTSSACVTSDFGR